MNGSKRRCKRVYDDKNYILHTYFVWYWEDDTLDFYEKTSLQNKIIDSYEVDYFANEVNKIALEELRNGTIKPLEINFNQAGKRTGELSPEVFKIKSGGLKT